jgi:hypothetical protein
MKRFTSRNDVFSSRSHAYAFPNLLQLKITFLSLVLKNSEYSKTHGCTYRHGELRVIDPKYEGASWECCIPSASQDISHILSNPKVQYSVHNGSPVVRILGRINPVQTSTPYNFTIHSGVIRTSVTCGVITEFQHPPATLRMHHITVNIKINKRRPALVPTQPFTHSWWERDRGVALTIHPI